MVLLTRYRRSHGGTVYVWQRASWPTFRWSDAAPLPLVGEARRRQGHLLGTLRDLGFALRQDAQVGAVTEDVVRSAEIEGDLLDRASVRSSVARRLGAPEGGLPGADRRTDGIVAMALAAVSDASMEPRLNPGNRPTIS